MKKVSQIFGRLFSNKIRYPSWKYALYYKDLIMNKYNYSKLANFPLQKIRLNYQENPTVPEVQEPLVSANPPTH